MKIKGQLGSIFFLTIFIIALDVLGLYRYGRAIAYMAIGIMTALIFVLSFKGIQKLINSLLLLWPLCIYFLYLIFSSLWALYPFQTLYYSFGDLIFLVNSVVIVRFFQVYKVEGVYQLFHLITWMCILGTISQILINPDLTRLGVGSIFLAISLPFIYRNSNFSKKYIYFLLTISVALLLVSMSRTVIIVGFLNFLLSIIFLEPGLANKFKRVFTLFFFTSMLAGLLVLIPDTRYFFLKTLVRFFNIDLYSINEMLIAEGEDYLRISLIEEAGRLYPSYWFQGMGYMNFMQWYGENFNITYESFDGKKEIVGSNLHNSFQTWALEGGLFCLFIIGFLFFIFFRNCLSGLKSADLEIQKAKLLLLSSMLSLFVFAFFHQLHQSLVFFIILSLGLTINTIYPIEPKNA